MPTECKRRWMALMSPVNWVGNLLWGRLSSLPVLRANNGRLETLPHIRSTEGRYVDHVKCNEISASLRSHS